MDLSRFREILIQDEGKKNYVYRDSEDHLTIGVGHLMATKVQPDTYKKATGEAPPKNEPASLPSDIKPISDDAVCAILDDDTDNAIIEARQFMISPSMWEGLGDARREVIVNMAFNLGYRKLNKFVRFKQALMERKYGKAADEMLDSRWSGQVKGRAKRLAKVMRTNNPAHFYDIGFARRNTQNPCSVSLRPVVQRFIAAGNRSIGGLQSIPLDFNDSKERL